MSTKVTMPQLGESVDEATITRWLKSVGEPVEEFEPLLEVNTDKVDSEIPSPAAGVVLDILIPEGATINAGDLLAWIGPAGAEAPASEEEMPQAEQPAAAPEITSQPANAPAAPAAAPTLATAKPPTPGRDRQLGFISPV
ncbi:MAG TPA: biotin/lipoyl-containing protein, partial [Anaerolineales bacterium]|nr:biotin/lipoyl-containing protein [Anaerolineales bacterium]